jgi:hypothetical protein
VGGARYEILAQGMSIPIIDSEQYSRIDAVYKAEQNPFVCKPTCIFMPMPSVKKSGFNLLDRVGD